ncbi:RDD family protein [Ilumatobacter coccineus]|jgi:uncharacterized RDD family membrane protein YckC|uniref:RDD domain-containing protein n=1 Tax=Ilumatobacter coccineus (strain NBRC 103263 / KCTC 29153 / YM16-304) TaxID=1313172 RepID=A0A6C7EAB7_ILUCY|nr:RDD family protein [Ilumatobacter coccineus]BAN01568.1 hypothetical protein YM304_12540 [Ilumatobacter coccineus YM16-304]
MTTTEHTGIITPEAVVLDVETAGFASRILAGVIDMAAIVISMALVGGIVSIILGGGDSTSQTVFAFTFFALIFGYPILFETFMRGRTPGKVALGLRAVTIDGAPIRLREATLRAMGGIVDRLLPPGGITGAIFVTITPRNQRVGDLIAGTIVIRDPVKFVPSPALWFSAPAGLETFAESIDPTAITVEQYTVIRSFLTRGATLSPEIRYALATDFADRLAATIRHQNHRAVQPEYFLICAMARYQRRFGPGRANSVAVS